MRKRIAILIIFLIILFSGNSVFANEVKKGNYSKKYEEWLQLTDEEKSKTIPPLTVNLRKSKETITDQYRNLLKNTTIPKKYDLREHINVEVKNQMETGSCWAFSATSTLETNLALKGESYNFSERNVEYSTVAKFNDGINEYGLNRFIGNGGMPGTAFAYYSRGSGPVLEEDMPFENNEYVISLSKLPQNATVKKTDNLIYFPNIYKRIGFNGNVIFEDGNGLEYTQAEVNEIRSEIKQHIMNYGGISTDIVAPNVFYNEETHAANMNVRGYFADHTVTIIGWDDNYSKENFIDKPSTDGAYIVLNSWGTDWGENGIYYISYEDLLVESTLRGVTSISDIEYDTLYQYDICEMYNYIESKYGANVYTAKENGKLEQVMVGSLAYQICNIYVSVEENGFNMNNRIKVANDVVLKPGYNTISLTSDINVTKGKKFAIIVELTNNNFYGIGIEDNIYDFANVRSNPNESFVSENGTEWNDIYDSSNNMNLSIKAYVKENKDYVNVTNIEYPNNALFENIGGIIKIRMQTSNTYEGSTFNISIYDNLKNNVTSLFATKIDKIKDRQGKILIYAQASVKKGDYTIEVRDAENVLCEIPFKVISKNFDSDIYMKVQIEDKNFYNALKNNVLKGDELYAYFDDTQELIVRKDIEILDLEGTQINLRGFVKFGKGYKIENINGIENFTALKHLILSGNQIDDFAPIANLTELEDLQSYFGMNAYEGRVYNKKIKNVEVIGNLNKLTRLELTNAELEDISFLSNLTNLESLDLQQNRIKDISCYRSFPKLRWTSLQQNQITDISPLKDLTNLRTLDLQMNKISDISYIENLSRLEDLLLWGNKVEDASVVEELDCNQISLYYQMIEKDVVIEDDSDVIFEIPEIIKQAWNPDSVLYSDEGIILMNCEWNEPGVSIKIHPNTGIRWAYIGVNSGFANGTSCSINLVEKDKLYTATFVLDNGEDDIVKSQKYGTKLEAPTNFTKEGCTFKGWNPEVPETMPGEDTIYEAMWEVITDTTDVGVVKEWENDEDLPFVIRPESVEVQLYRYSYSDEGSIGMTTPESMGEEYKVVLNQENDWSYRYENLPLREGNINYGYDVLELNEEGNPVSNGGAYDQYYTATYEEIASIGQNGKTVIITNTYIPTTSINVVKQWENDEDLPAIIRPESVEVQLYRYSYLDEGLIGMTALENMGEEYRVVLNEENNWSYRYENLPVGEGNVNYGYDVLELNEAGNPVSNGGTYNQYYIATYEESANTGANGRTVTITNTYTSTTSINVVKQWENDENLPAIIRPESVEVQLYRYLCASDPDLDGMSAPQSMGEEYKVVLNEENNWSYRYENLPLRDENANYGYEVLELDKEGNPVGNGGAYDQYYTATYEESANTGANGKTVTITNTYRSTTDIDVVKQWENDENLPFIIRPESIEVQLYRYSWIYDPDLDGATAPQSMGEEYKVVLSEENNWSYRYENLPLKEGNVNYEYAVLELDEEGNPVAYRGAYNQYYKTTYEESANTGANGRTVTITNTYIPKTSINVEKQWENDENLPAIIRPKSVEVQLYRYSYLDEGLIGMTALENMGEEYKVVLSEENNWSYRYENLLLKDGNVNYGYNVFEIDEEGNIVTNGEAYNQYYTATYEESANTGANGKTVTITNTYRSTTDIDVDRIDITVPEIKVGDRRLTEEEVECKINEEIDVTPTVWWEKYIDGEYVFEDGVENIFPQEVEDNTKYRLVICVSARDYIYIEDGENNNIDNIGTHENLRLGERMVVYLNNERIEIDANDQYENHKDIYEYYLGDMVAVFYYIDTTKGIEVDTTKYEVTKDEETKIEYVTNISAKTNMKEMVEDFVKNGNVEIYRGETKIEYSSEENAEMKIATGDKIKITLNGETAEYIVIVKGDVNGDGQVTVRDIISANALRETAAGEILEKYKLLAADINKNGTVEVRDLISINALRD